MIGVIEVEIPDGATHVKGAGLEAQDLRWYRLTPGVRWETINWWSGEWMDIGNIRPSGVLELKGYFDKVII